MVTTTAIRAALIVRDACKLALLVIGAVCFSVSTMRSDSFKRMEDEYLRLCSRLAAGRLTPSNLKMPSGTW